MVLVQHQDAHGHLAVGVLLSNFGADMPGTILFVHLDGDHPHLG